MLMFGNKYQTYILFITNEINGIRVVFLLQTQLGRKL